MKKSVIFLFLISLIFMGCDSRKRAIGKSDEIFVVADTAEYLALEPTLIETFEKVIYTPQPENLFTLKRIPFENFDKIKNKKNVIIISPLNSNSLTAKYIKKNLSKDVRSLVEEDSLFVFNKYNLWANGQIVMILSGPDLEKLNNKILMNKDELIYYFQKFSNERLATSLYNGVYEKKLDEAKLLKEFGWTIFVQSDFQIAKKTSEDNFVWLRRAANSDMERWIFISWIENSTPALLNVDSLKSIRNRITKKYYRTSDEKTFVKITDNPFSVTVSEVDFGKKYSLLMQGFWQFEDFSGGGPFLSYSFYDPKSKRFYMVDGSIYAPKYFKKDLIQQVDVLLQSFKLKHELSLERIEDLFDELD